MFARTLKAAGLSVIAAGFSAVLVTGCSGINNPLAFRTGDAQPLMRQAAAIKDSVPMPPPVPRELDKTVLTAYIVEPGDGLLVQPVNLDSPARLPADQTVLPDGKIDLGLYGRVLVAGKSVEQIEAQVQSIVQAKTPNAGQINVRLVSRVSKMFYVLGQVNSPGSFPLQGRETVLDGIVAAGGLNSRASRLNIIVSRPTAPHGCRVVLPVCYRNIVQLGDTTTNYQLQPGDRIYVPAMDFWAGIFGEDQELKKGCSPCKGPQNGCPWNCDGPAALAPELAAPAGLIPAPAFGATPPAIPPAVPASPPSLAAPTPIPPSGT
jgi:protein involved in polysaccharide export with SLBB domain